MSSCVAVYSGEWENRRPLICGRRPVSIALLPIILDYSSIPWPCWKSSTVPCIYTWGDAVQSQISIWWRVPAGWSPTILTLVTQKLDPIKNVPPVQIFQHELFGPPLKNMLSFDIVGSSQWWELLIKDTSINQMNKEHKHGTPRQRLPVIQRQIWDHAVRMQQMREYSGTSL